MLDLIARRIEDRKKMEVAIELIKKKLLDYQEGLVCEEEVIKEIIQITHSKMF